MKRLLPFLFLLGSCNLAIAQVIDVPAKYGTTTANANLTAQATWGSYAALKAARPAYVGWLEARGVTQAEALKMYRGELDIEEGLWANEQCIPCGQVYTDGCGQRGIVTFKLPGVFLMTAPLEPKFAKFDFGGTSAYAGSGWATGGTCLKVDVNNWNHRVWPAEIVFACNDWGQPANAGGNYAEGLEIHGVMIDGGRSLQAYNASVTGYGIAIRNAGSACSVSNVVVNGAATAGFAWAGGIPIFAENTRSFYNGKFGYHFIGTALSTGVLIGCETDDCGSHMFGFEAGYGQMGGGNITIYSSKAENGKNLVNGAVRPMSLAYVRGSAGAIQFIGFKSALYNNVTVPTAFDVQGSNTTVTVTGFTECGSQGQFTKMLTTASKSYGMTTTGGNTCRPVSWITNCTTMTGCSLPLSGTTQPDAIVQIVPVLPIEQDTTDPVTCAPGTVTRDGQPFGQVDSGGTIDVPSNCPAPIDPYTYGSWGPYSTCKSGKQTRKRYQIQTKTCP